ncbi:MAG: hypothetical protein ACYTHN_22595, partial [Planctomycetota bacterium]
MSKLLTFALVLAAFVTAVYFVTRRRNVPRPARRPGLRRNFLVAVGLFAALLVGDGCGKNGPQPMCYKTAPTGGGEEMTRQGLVQALREVWLTLDMSQSSELGLIVDSAAEKGVIRKKVASMLRTAFDEIAGHRKREKSPVTCYMLTELGMHTRNWRDRASIQVEALARAREAGTLDEVTCELALDSLAADIERLYLANRLDGEEVELFLGKLRKQQPVVVRGGDAAMTAASIIVQMEGGRTPSFTPSSRLDRMRERVDSLFIEGPARNDWEDPAISPNVTSILEKAGLVRNPPHVTCYRRMAGPPVERSEELKKLQKELLDRSVEAGILPVELAGKAAMPSPAVEKPEFALEEDIAAFQKKVRRAVRLLYKWGEITSEFVKRLEAVVDVEIVRFTPSRALRNDVNYHLRSVLKGSAIGEKVLPDLLKLGILKKDASYRWALNWR